MYDIDIYYKKLKFNNMNYSIDMLRLKTYITYSQYCDLEFLINSAYKNNIKRFWISDKIMNFHYQYQMEFGDYRFWFGFLHNNESVNYNREDLSYNFTIEFNPNKLRENVLIMHILSHFGNWLIRSFDLAIDIPINILDIVFDMASRRKLMTYSLGDDNITHVIGVGNGRVKIYNKKIESSLNIVGHLTRVEISFQYEDFPVSKIQRFAIDDGYFPYLYLNQYLYSFSDIESGDKTTLGLLYAVQHGYNIKDLSRRYREKIKELLEGGSRIKFDKTTAEQVIKQVIFGYLVRRECKQVIY